MVLFVSYTLLFNKCALAMCCHLLSAVMPEHVLGIRSKLDYINFSGLSYEMIFGKLVEQEKFTRVYHLMLQARDDILMTDASTSDT